MDALNTTTPRNGLWNACVVAILGGALVGLVGGTFRAGLAWLDANRTLFVEWSHTLGWWGFLFPIAMAALGAGIARLLIGKYTIASGSGVQHVEAIAHGKVSPAPPIVLPIKFFGGLLAIGSGLALGREGPTVQMGSVIATSLSKFFRCAQGALRDLQAALGGAGLAVAFNAPIGGALFVFEEVTKSFRLRLTMVTLLGTAIAITISRLILGDTPDFRMSAHGDAGPWMLLLYTILGFLLGLLGAAYNKFIIFGLDAIAKLQTLSPVARAALVGAIVGLVAWFLPSMVGGGDPLAQNVLDGKLPITLVILAFVIRWLLGPLSYSAGTPGGLFSPLLVVGGIFGALMATIFNLFIPEISALPIASFAAVGMVAFFTGIVRAPFTGIVLIMEMTATTSLALPMMLAAFAAMLSTTIIRSEPIYDTLGRRMINSLKNTPTP